MMGGEESREKKKENETSQMIDVSDEDDYTYADTS